MHTNCRILFPRHIACFVSLLLAFGVSTPWSVTAAERHGNHTAAEYAEHVRELKKKLPSDDFTIVVMPPFVVIGDEEPAEVRRRAKHTVQWAVEKLKAAYFEKDPDDILDIWLFKDKESYEENAEKLFHSKPDTPYGYYSSADKALVMNIATGGGTLVHEIVHPFVAANFPECPAWFNEGLGSLYEQSGEKDGRIVGHTNWRLPGLQKAIRKKRVPSFKTLCSTTTDEFYEKDRGHELRPGPIPVLLLAGARAVAEVLPPLLRQPQERPHRLRHAARNPRPQGHGRVSARVGGVRAEAAVPLITSPNRRACLRRLAWASLRSHR